MKDSRRKIGIESLEKEATDREQNFLKKAGQTAGGFLIFLTLYVLGLPPLLFLLVNLGILVNAPDWFSTCFDGLLIPLDELYSLIPAYGKYIDWLALTFEQP